MNVEGTPPCHCEPERSEWCGNPMTAYSLAPCGGCKGNHRAGRDVCDPACGGKAAEEGWGEGAYKKCAFTIAEVLITLGIIGVVAALTIPTLMQKTNEQETVAKVKSSYSNFSNAFNLAESHYGSADKWTETCGEVYSNNSEEYTQYKLNSTDWVGFKYILDFLKTNKNCGHEEVCFEGANNNTFAHYILANGVPVVFYKHPTRQCQGINIEGGFCATVVIKTDKNPNSVQGKNTFEFGINANKFLPFGYNDLDDSNCLASKDSSCTGYIIRHGNMDYLD